MVEMMIAVSIISILVLVVMSVASKSITVSRQALHVSQANFLLEEGAEVVRIFRDNNSWSSGTNFTNMFYNFAVRYIPSSISSWTTSLPYMSFGNLVGIFTRTVRADPVSRDNITNDIVANGASNSSVDSGTKLMTITVSWPEGEITVTKTLKFYIMDIFS